MDSGRRDGPLSEPISAWHLHVYRQKIISLKRVFSFQMFALHRH